MSTRIFLALSGRDARWLNSGASGATPAIHPAPAIRDNGPLRVALK